MGDSGVVFGQSKDLGPVRIRPALDGPSQVPGTCRKVGLGIKEIGILKGSLPSCLSPILSRSGGHLHESALPRGAYGLRVEIALSPHYGTNQGDGETMAIGRLDDKRFEFLRATNLSKPREGDECKWGENHDEGSKNPRTCEKHRSDGIQFDLKGKAGKTCQSDEKRAEPRGERVPFCASRTRIGFGSAF